MKKLRDLLGIFDFLILEGFDIRNFLLHTVTFLTTLSYGLRLLSEEDDGLRFQCCKCFKRYLCRIYLLRERRL